MKQVGDMPQPPLIHSVSYGNDEKQQTSTAYMNSVNVQFQKAGTRGLSVLFASGDQGVWGRSGTLGRRFHPLAILSRFAALPVSLTRKLSLLQTARRRYGTTKASSRTRS